ncbi:PIG-L family deacetylase [Streptomyces roseirectus]|uniref:PIG-L family deacetylase n=1 Tax=Streptomyces roseirectus TaxID=2768066 RepID=A0A7H0IRM9_9ACTN|nr:sugar-binding protein [Streptomyces roseirectus]QNP75445.1 PIG-L family deacetylase [Streptomyces roseirectus]
MRRRTLLTTALALGAVAAGHAPAHRPDPAHNDVLFIGAHPDDEAQNLATFGQWHEHHGLTTGIITVTRGEGGGNATGPEEGAALGLIRETEERAATAYAGIENIYYLDKPDFWYTLSAPLTARIWDEDDTLERIVHLIRRTTPHTVVTMDPRPAGQHGAHQLSARLAIEAFWKAADPTAFPAPGLAPWRAVRLLAQNPHFTHLLGPDESRKPRTDPHTGLPVLGVWSGTPSRVHRTTWAQAERTASRAYRTQGWTSLHPHVPTDPARLDSDWFTLLADDSRPIEAPVRDSARLRPRYAEFHAWAHRTGLPWLANGAQPDHPRRPSTTIPAVSRPPAGPDAYPGPELPLTHWEGDTPTPADCSATARLARHGDDLYVLVHVTDDRPGAALAPGDVKRHWRTDAVEIALDPRGDSDDTSTTFKTGIVPRTAPHGGPAAERDADHHQGPAPASMRVTATVTDPYRGYTIEARIPLSALPAPADPDRFALNILVYDSDTNDHTGQTRLAWSPHGTPQADPYVWGTAHLPGHTPAPPTPTTPPIIPTEAATSATSPAALTQAHRTGIPIPAPPRPHSSGSPS